LTKRSLFRGSIYLFQLIAIQNDNYQIFGLQTTSPNCIPTMTASKIFGVLNNKTVLWYDLKLEF